MPVALRQFCGQDRAAARRTLDAQSPSECGRASAPLSMTRSRKISTTIPVSCDCRSGTPGADLANATPADQPVVLVSQVGHLRPACWASPDSERHSCSSCWRRPRLTERQARTEWSSLPTSGTPPRYTVANGMRTPMLSHSVAIPSARAPAAKMMRSETRGRVGWAVTGTSATPVSINEKSSQGSGTPFSW